MGSGLTIQRKGMLRCRRACTSEGLQLIRLRLSGVRSASRGRAGSGPDSGSYGAAATGFTMCPESAKSAPIGTHGSFTTERLPMASWSAIAATTPSASVQSIFSLGPRRTTWATARRRGATARGGVSPTRNVESEPTAGTVMSSRSRTRTQRVGRHDQGRVGTGFAGHAQEVAAEGGPRRFNNPLSQLLVLAWSCK